MSSLSDGCFVDVNMLGVRSDEASRLQHTRNGRHSTSGTAYSTIEFESGRVHVACMGRGTLGAPYLAFILGGTPFFHR